jgi:hypothetical protein
MEIVMVVDPRHLCKVSERIAAKQSAKGIYIPAIVNIEFTQDYVDGPSIAEVSPLSMLSSDHGQVNKHSNPKASNRFQPYNTVNRRSRVH